MNTIPSTIIPGAEAAFSPAEYAARRTLLQGLMDAHGIDTLLVTGPENIFYLCGQQTPGYYFFQCLVVPRRGEPVLLVRGLEALNAWSNAVVARVVGYDDGQEPAAALAALLAEGGWTGAHVAMERTSWFLPPATFERIVALTGPKLDGSGLVERLRRVKSAAELDRIERSMRTTDAGMAAGLAAVMPGASENDVAAAILSAGVRAGSEFLGMEPLICSGPRSGIPHATWRRRVLQTGDLIALENAGCIDRYHTALYRTASLGTPAANVLAMYALCCEALEAGTAAMVPGQSCADVHAAVEAVFARAGHLDGFRKRSGYSLGIAFAPDWGEGNVMSLYRGVDVPLEPGMVFHLPMTLRDWGVFTVAVSDCIVVTENGNRCLSRLGRELLVRPAMQAKIASNPPDMPPPGGNR